MTLKCRCGATCRIPSLPKTRVRCGACKHEFTPQELTRAVPEATPVLQRLPGDDYELEQEDDDFPGF